MSGKIIKADQLEAERSLLAIRGELERLHRLSPNHLPKTKYTSIITLLPTAQDLLTGPPPPPTMASHAYTTLRYIYSFLISAIFRLYWLFIHLLAGVGGITVFIIFVVYILSKLDWKTTYTGQGQGWQQHSDGYYYWGMPEESYATATVRATVRPEIEGREL